MPQGVTDLAIGLAGAVGGVATQSIALAAPFAGDMARKSAVTPMAPPPPERASESRQERAERLASILVKVVENRLTGRAAGGARPLEELLAGALSVADPGVIAALARGPRRAKITVDVAGRIVRVELLDAAKPGDPADLAWRMQRALRTLTLAGSRGGYVVVTVGAIDVARGFSPALGLGRGAEAPRLHDPRSASATPTSCCYHRRMHKPPTIALFASLALAVAILVPLAAMQSPSPSKPALERPGENHIRNIRQLTNGGENAEAYFSFDGRKLIFQSTAGHACDQIYTMNVDGLDRRLVSTGKGRTTCSYFYPDGRSILYASTHKGGDACPPVPSFDQGYVWPVYDTYDIYRANPDGSNLVPLTTTPGYDAEATIAKRRAGGVHQRARRRHGDLLDERGRFGRSPADEQAGARWRSVLLRGRLADRVPGPPRARARARRLPDVVEEGALEADLARDLRDEPGRQRDAAGHEPQVGELRAVLHARRQADHLLVELRGPQAAELRPLPRERGRDRDSSASRTTTRSTASRCSRPTAARWSLPPTATRRRKGRRTCSWRSG